MPKQHSDESDGKTFASKAPERSPEFGVAQQDRNDARGTIPGKPQWEPLYPDPELGS